MLTFNHAAVLVLVALAAVTDVRGRRIPNALTFGAAAAALVFHAATGGAAGLGISAGGWALGLAIFFPVFALRGMGAGDVKLLAAVGAWVGPLQVIWVALLTSIVGGVLGVAVALGHGYLRIAIRNLMLLLTHWRMVGLRPMRQVTLDNAPGPRLAYAIPISLGTVMTLWLM